MRTLIRVSISLIIFLATNAYALTPAQINNMAESKEWVIGANPGAGGYLYTKTKWKGPKDYNYNLKGLVIRKFFHYEKQGSLGGINLGWTNNASAETGKKRAKWYFTRSSNAKGPIKYGEYLAIAWHNTGYIYYASRNSGINLKWSKKPHYQWQILGGRNGTPVRRGKDKVIIYNTRHKYPMIYYKRKGAGHIGWPDSTDWSVRGQVRDSAIVVKNFTVDTATTPLRAAGLVERAEIDTYKSLKRGQKNCKKKRDTCINCNPPVRNDDKDRDGISDLLEYNLAHKFFPNVMVYGDKYDLEQSYLKNGYSTPYIVKEIGGGQCGNVDEKKCLEIRLGITFAMDAGDDISGGWGAHIGDSEMYMAVVKRKGSWAQARNNANQWQIIRDFTSAHWGKGGAFDSSKMEVYPGGRSERVTIHSATRKHALYHSNSACDGGTLAWADDCPGRGRNLIQYKKRNSLQNIGSRKNNIGMDTTIAHPVCGVYHVWGDRAFAEDDPFSNYIEKKVDYELGSNARPAVTTNNRPRPAPVRDHRTNKRPTPRSTVVRDHRTPKPRSEKVIDHRICKKYIQGKVAWDYKGNKRWSASNIKALCKGAESYSQPGRCFNDVMHGGVNWGGGTKWTYKNVMNLCKGTHNSSITIACFKNKVKKKGWKKAIEACN
ncbi:MAG: hypothetical protein KAT25_07340 [Sulfuriflexus sp.]|nr:hypothetical protein [Sulfuriflexus sp.]